MLHHIFERQCVENGFKELRIKFLWQLSINCLWATHKPIIAHSILMKMDPVSISRCPWPDVMLSLIRRSVQRDICFWIKYVSFSSCSGSVAFNIVCVIIAGGRRVGIHWCFLPLSLALPQTLSHWVAVAHLQEDPNKLHRHPSNQFSNSA